MSKHNYVATHMSGWVVGERLMGEMSGATATVKTVVVPTVLELEPDARGDSSVHV